MPNEAAMHILGALFLLAQYPEAVRMTRYKIDPSSKNMKTELQEIFILKIKLEDSLHLVSEKRYLSMLTDIC